MYKIISLTSIPPRFEFLKNTLDSLIKQKAADEIRLNIPKSYKRFSHWDGKLPKLSSKVNIVRCDEDLGPATKILPTALDHINEDIQILFCDDDGIFPKYWAKNLFEFQSQKPNMAIATWGRCIDEIPNVKLDPYKNYAQLQKIEIDIRYRFERILQKIFKYKPLYRPVKTEGYAQLLLGVGGVVIKPNFFNESAIKIPAEAFYVDDIWLSAQLTANHINIYCPKRYPVPYSHTADRVEALFDLEIGGGRRKLNYDALIWCRNNLNVW